MKRGTMRTFDLKSFYIYSSRSKTDPVEVFVLGYRFGSQEAVEDGPKTLTPSPDGTMELLTFSDTFAKLRQVVVRVEEAGKRVAYALDDITVAWSC